MSFSGIVKNEASKLNCSEVESLALLSAVIRNGAVISNDIKITSENPSVARCIFNLVKDIYYITPRITVRKGFNYQKKYIYILQITDKVDYIIKDLSIKNVPSNYIVDDEESIRAYLRGVFLMTGSINDPKKSRYHLEFLVDNQEYANYINCLLNGFHLNSKIIKRDNKYMIYIKEAEKIGDFLRLINAYNAVLYYEDIRIYRDHKNMTNRLNNCEQANVDRTIETALNQVRDIELIMEKASLDLLDDKEKIVAKYRLKYKEASLTELSEIISIEMDKPITKSGIYHRLNKIKILANRIRENSK